MMKNKVCIITGATSGIGKETTKGLARKEASIVMAVRDEKKAKAVQKSIKAETGNHKIDYIIVDLAVQTSIRNFVQLFKEKYEKLDVLINNAGIMTSKRQVTTDGMEKTLAVNHLAPFMLTNLLFDRLQKSSAGRVVNVSSGLHKNIKTSFLNDIQSQKEYNGMETYSRTKLANILFTYELDHRLTKEQIRNVTVNVLHPGLVSTNLGVEDGSFFNKYIFNYLIRPIIGINPKKGAQTSIYLATSPHVENVSGKYFYKKQQVRSSELSYNRELQKQLWDVSIELTNLKELPL